MKNLMLPLVGVLGFAGCTDGPVVDYDARQDVVVEGVPHVVFPMLSGPNNYQAREASLMGGLIDPNDYRQNILAIEAVTGCTVNRGSVINQGLITMAAVICD